MKTTSLIVCAHLILSVGFCQEPFQGREIEKWLDQAALSVFFEVDTLLLDKQRVDLHLGIKSNFENATAFLEPLRKKELDIIQSQEANINLSEYILKSVAHLVGRNYRQVIIHIHSNQFKNLDNTQIVYPTVSSFSKAAGLIEGSKRGFSTKPPVSVDLKKLGDHGLFKHEILEGSVKHLKEQMKTHYSKKFPASKFVEIVSWPDELTIRVDYMKGEVIEKYFEYVTFNCKLVVDKDELHIYYLIQGKYASGIFGAPPFTSEDCKNMEPRYSAELGEYVHMINPIIEGFFNSKWL